MAHQCATVENNCFREMQLILVLVTIGLLDKLTMINGYPNQASLSTLGFLKEETTIHHNNHAAYHCTVLTWIPGSRFLATIIGCGWVVKASSHTFPPIRGKSVILSMELLTAF